MQGIESAIRNALIKADANDPAARQRIYEAVWSTHERTMAANTNLSDQQRLQRRDQLQAIIVRIEQNIRGKELPTPTQSTTPAPDKNPITSNSSVEANTNNDGNNSPQPSTFHMAPELDPADIRSQLTDHQLKRPPAARKAPLTDALTMQD